MNTAMLKAVKRYLVSIFHLDYFYLRYINFRYGLKLSYKTNRDGLHILREIFSKKVYSKLFPFEKNVTVIDVGGHYGFFAIYAAFHTEPESKIYSLEPSKLNYITLKKNIDSFQKNKVIALNIGMSGKSGERILATGKAQNHSLYKNYIPGLTESEVINTVSLEDFILKNKIKQVDFLKMDCEGSEYEIIKHTSASTFAKINVISLEMHDMRHEGFEPSDIFKKLRENGFLVLNNDVESSLFNFGFNTHFTFYKSSEMSKDHQE